MVFKINAMFLEYGSLNNEMLPLAMETTTTQPYKFHFDFLFLFLFKLYSIYITRLLVLLKGYLVGINKMPIFVLRHSLYAVVMDFFFFFFKLEFYIILSGILYQVNVSCFQ